MSTDNLFSFILIISILALFFTFCAVVIKRYWIDKKSITSGSQFVGEEIYMQWQNKDKKRAIEQVIYQKEEEEEDDDEGEDVDPSSKTNKKIKLIQNFIWINYHDKST